MDDVLESYLRQPLSAEVNLHHRPIESIAATVMFRQWVSKWWEPYTFKTWKQ